MNLKPSNFHIYNASAGSGKTYSIVKAYLKVLFTSTNRLPFKDVLAITFTNKAVGEMKDRVLDVLMSFSNEAIIQNPNAMFLDICLELNMKPAELHSRSINMLNVIAHNYAAFDISTIDKFNQRLIRTFAFDLNLPLNFEVELDTEAVLNKAVDQLIHKAGHNKELTKIMLDFAMEKLEDDRSWDIAFDFNKIAKLLIQENHYEHVSNISDKTYKDFHSLKQLLTTRIRKSKSALIDLASSALQKIEERGLEHNDFLGANGYLPSYFIKLRNGIYDLSYDKVWMNKLESHPLYPKSTPENLQIIIDEIQPELCRIFNATKEAMIDMQFNAAIYRNLTPLSVLTAIYQELESIKSDQNLLLISEFNSVVSKHLKEQAAPFIYERIGERYRHFFIDEFQDTSVMQWENLIPLIGNSLSAEGSSTTLVGDAKQAIYRWRGGRAEQFIALHDGLINPFPIDPDVKQLEYNFRSAKSIVHFNNNLYRFASESVFSNGAHEKLYASSGQKDIIEKDGYVRLSFLDTSENNDLNDLYPSKILEIIKECLANGYQPKDITILVRFKKDGITVAEYLNEQSELNIISSETLLLSRSPEVLFIMDLLQFLAEDQNQEAKFRFLQYLISNHFPKEEFHSKIKPYLSLQGQALFNRLKELDIDFNLTEALELPIYELAEVITHTFKIVPDSNGYVQYLLDFIWEYSLTNEASLTSLIQHYEEKKESLSLTATEGIDAINIMTIHKAKGLEFPVVIVPYADLNIYNDRNARTWFPLNANEYSGFSETLINLNKEVVSFGPEGDQIYYARQSELELDNMNLLYVALTRAVNNLFILTKHNPWRKKQAEIKTWSDLFVNFLDSEGIWNDQKQNYEWGNNSPNELKVEEDKNSEIQTTFLSTPKKDLNLSILTNAGYLWDTDQAAALEKGNLIHLILSMIKNRNDVEFAFQSLLNSGTLNDLQKEQLKPQVDQLVSHPKLSTYFDQDVTAFIERDILIPGGKSIRPDRLVINDRKEAIIIDYKTGNFDKSHEDQLLNYERAISKLGYDVTKKILIYINDQIEIKEM